MNNHTSTNFNRYCYSIFSLLYAMDEIISPAVTTKTLGGQ
jgi:hypothetical protein